MPRENAAATQTVIVTGGGHGLGRAYAMHLAERGANVALNDIDEEAGLSVVTEIQNLYGHDQAFFAKEDVADYEQSGALVEKTLAQYGEVHGVIANAGILRDRSFLKMGIRDFHDVLTVHLLGTVNITHHAWPHFVRNNYGRLVFTSSSAGLWGNFGQANYCAAKFGIIGLMLTLKLEGESRNIKVNTIAPYAMSRLAKGVFPEGLEKELTTEQISSVVLHLCSDACRLNGEIIELGAGRMTRVKMMRTEGVLFDTPLMPEDVEEILTELLDQPMEKTFSSATDAFSDHMSHQEY